MDSRIPTDFWSVSGARLELTRTVIMGILNVTPDSFSDGGLHSTLDASISRAFEMLDEGAGILDIGGESSRPGSSAVETKVELRRVIPVIERVIVERPETIISIDTCKAEVAKAALDTGVRIVNDITAGLGDPEMANIVSNSDCGVILMHMRGTPKSMQENPDYVDVVTDVQKFLHSRIEVFEQAGVARERIAIDPGIGFGKKLEHNIELIRNISVLNELGCPVLIGASRKSMLGEITGRKVGERLAASIAVALSALLNGAAVLRVHDVKETVDALRVWQAIYQ
jgi:dihydropteroate synthase